MMQGRRMQERMRATHCSGCEATTAALLRHSKTDNLLQAT